MLKASSKRRRTLAQCKADKEAAAKKEADIEAQAALVVELQQQLLEAQQQNQTGKVAANLMSQMINSGVVVAEPNDEFTVRASGSASKFKPFEAE